MVSVCPAALLLVGELPAPGVPVLGWGLSPVPSLCTVGDR